MTSRRSMQVYDERISRALQFRPGHVGGRVDSAQPVRRRGGTLRTPTAPPVVPVSPARQFRLVPGPVVVHGLGGGYDNVAALELNVQSWNSGLDPYGASVASDWPMVTLTVTAPDAQTYSQGPTRTWGSGGWVDATTGMTDPTPPSLDWVGTWTVEAEAVWNDAYTLTDSWTFDVDMGFDPSGGAPASETDYTWSATDFLKDAEGAGPPPPATYGCQSYFFAEGDAGMSYAGAAASWTVAQLGAYQRRIAWAGLIRRWTGRDGLQHGWADSAVNAFTFDWPTVTDPTRPPSLDFTDLLIAALGANAEDPDPYTWEPAYDYTEPPL